MRTAILSLSLVSAVNGLYGQAAPRLEFEVASVKPAPLPNGGPVRIGARGGPGSADPSRVNYSFASLKLLLTVAYGVKAYQISGPPWLDSERFDIVATVPPGATKEQANVMLQNLLADRFQLALHHETKELPIYELVVAKNGPKLKETVVDPTAPPPAPPGPGPLPIGKNGLPIAPPGAMLMMMTPKGIRMMASKQSIPKLAEQLASQLARPVIDKTGLTGEYDYTLEFSSEGLATGIGLPPPPPPPPGAGGPEPKPGGVNDLSDAPSLLTAVQEQLGLKLEQKRGPVDILVIDHGEKVPTEN